MGNVNAITRAKRTGDVLSLVGSAIGGCLLAMTWRAFAGQWSSPGGAAIVLGSLAAVAGTYLCLILLLLVARIPALERWIGHDRLLGFHRYVAPWAMALIGAHLVLTTLGYAAASGTGVWAELWSLVSTYPWMMPAAAAAVVFVIAGTLSAPAVRRRLKYETWWVGHLYFYLAIALAFGHQLTSGPVFAADTLMRSAWIAIYVVVFGSILLFRFGAPLWKSYWHGLRVSKVIPAGKGTYHVVIKGRDLKRFAGEGGQFFKWRFCTRHQWWQAHPYSLSAKSTSRELRITIKVLGDSSAQTQGLRPGTRVIAEGPYGTFTVRGATAGRGIAMFAAGVGITPMRAMLEDLEPGRPTALVYRVSADDRTLVSELRQVAQGRAQLHVLPGSRDEWAIDPWSVSRAIPGIADFDVFVCGPDEFVRTITTAVTFNGVPSDRIHVEEFAW